MLLEPGEDAQLDIGERAHGQRHPLGRQTVDEPRILDAAHPVIDPLDPEHVERLPDVLGRPLLAGVRDGPEAVVARTS